MLFEFPEASKDYLANNLDLILISIKILTDNIKEIEANEVFKLIQLFPVFSTIEEKTIFFENEQEEEEDLEKLEIEC